MRYLVLFFGTLLLSALAQAESPPQPPAKVVTMPVIETTVAESSQVMGILYFDRISQLSTEVGGLVKSVHFKNGDRVKKGDVLLRLNTDLLEKDIAVLQARIDQLAVRVEHTEKDLHRYKELFEQQAASEKTYDDLMFTARGLEQEKLGLINELEKARLKKAKSVIHAPYDGLILEKCADVGDWMLQGKVLCRLGAGADVFLKVPVTEDLMRFAHKGERVEVRLNALDMRVEGVMAGVLPVADAKTKNIFLKIRLPQISPVVENMSATVFVPASHKKKMKTVPRDALIKYNGADFIYTVVEKKATILPVTVLSYMGERVGVISPHIVVGMPIVVDGNERLKPDQPVRIVGES